MKTMYEITADLADVFAGMDYLNEQIEARAAEIEANGGVLPDNLAEQEAALLEKLDALLGRDVPKKLEALALVRRDLKARMEVQAAQRMTFINEAHRYAKRIEGLDRNLDRLKAMSTRLFTMSGMTRIDGERIKTRVQPGPMRVESLSADPPREFCTETWSLRDAEAMRLLDLIDEHDPELRGIIFRHRDFSPELAKAAAKAALAELHLAPIAGEGFDLPEVGLRVAWSATVVDW